jgi:hypothetical protein
MQRLWKAEAMAPRGRGFGRDSTAVREQIQARGNKKGDATSNILKMEPTMEHKTLDQVGRVAEVCVDRAYTPALSRDERLARWAELLEQQPERRLNTLLETEYQTWETREAIRVANSPISVAFDDPVLRAEGLKDDSYGEARKFFDISDQQLHAIVCYCHYGATMSAEAAALRVRAAVSGMIYQSERPVRAWHVHDF